MGAQLTTAFVQQFSAAITTLSQQMESRLMPYVMSESITGEKAFFDQIGATTVQERTTRFGASPEIETPHSRRMIVPQAWEWGEFIDTYDKVQTLIDPASDYVKAAVMAFNRQKDKILISALTGTAYTGKTGTTSTVLPSAQKIDVGVGSTGSTGLNIEKLIRAKYIMDKNEVPEEQRVMVVTAKQMENLLNETEVKSADYNTVKALVNGQLNTFLGFNFVRTELLTLTVATDVRTCIAFQRDGIKMGINKDIVTEIEKRGDRSFNWYAYACMFMGASRMQETHVVEIPCDESP